jgi:hypothetical protein
MLTPQVPAATETATGTGASAWRAGVASLHMLRASYSRAGACCALCAFALDGTGPLCAQLSMNAQDATQILPRANAARRLSRSPPPLLSPADAPISSEPATRQHRRNFETRPRPAPASVPLRAGTGADTRAAARGFEKSITRHAPMPCTSHKQAAASAALAT